MTERWAEWVHRTDHAEVLEDAGQAGLTWWSIGWLLLTATAVVPLLLLWLLGEACGWAARRVRCR